MNRKSDRAARVISLASGKGGVGKTNIAVNLSLSLSRLRRRSMLVDCDLGLANAAIMMGLNVAETIEDVVDGSLSLDEIVVDGPDALFVVPGGSGGDAALALDLSVRRRLADAFRPHRRSLDYVIVDTPSGAAPDTLDLVAASDMILLVVSPEPTAFMDAYATAKMLTLDHGATQISVVSNMVDDIAAGHDLFRRFRDVAARFLPSELDFLGSIPRDDRVRLAVMRKRCCVEVFPDAAASQALGRLARTIDALQLPARQGGDCFFGMEALIGAY
jgi:flagellar biosynthesis protein FlhG